MIVVLQSLKNVAMGIEDRIMNNETLIKSYPAFDIFERKPNNKGFVRISDSDTLCCGVRLYYTGNIWSYSIERGIAPEEAHEKAIERGHPVRWINSKCSVISNTDVAKNNAIKVYAGMRVVYMGKKFTIEYDWNNNIKFVPFEENANV